MYLQIVSTKKIGCCKFLHLDFDIFVAEIY